MATRPLTRKATVQSGINLDVGTWEPLQTGLTPRTQTPLRGQLAAIFANKNSAIYGRTGSAGTEFTVTTAATNQLFRYRASYVKQFLRSKAATTQGQFVDENGWSQFGAIDYLTFDSYYGYNTRFFQGTGNLAKFDHTLCIDGFGLQSTLGDQNGASSAAGKLFPGHLYYTVFHQLKNSVTALTGSGDVNDAVFVGDVRTGFTTGNAAMIWEKDWTGTADHQQERLSSTPYEDCEMVEITGVSYASGPNETTINYKQLRYPNGDHFKTLASGGGSSSFTTNAVMAPLKKGYGGSGKYNWVFNLTEHCIKDHEGAGGPESGKVFRERLLDYYEANAHKDDEGYDVTGLTYLFSNYDATDKTMLDKTDSGECNSNGSGNTADSQSGFVGGTNVYFEGVKNFMLQSRERGRTVSFNYDGGSAGTYVVDSAATLSNGATAIISSVTDNGATGSLTLKMDLDYWLMSDRPVDNDTITANGKTASVAGTVTQTKRPMAQSGGGVHDPFKYVLDGSDPIEHFMEHESFFPTYEGTDNDAVDTKLFGTYTMRAKQIKDLAIFTPLVTSMNKQQGIYHGGSGTNNNTDSLKFAVAGSLGIMYSHFDLAGDDWYLPAAACSTASYYDPVEDYTYAYGEAIRIGAGKPAFHDNLGFAGALVGSIMQLPSSVTHEPHNGGANDNLIVEYDFDNASTDDLSFVKLGGASFDMAKNTGENYLKCYNIVGKRDGWVTGVRTPLFLEAAHNGFNLLVIAEVYSSIPNSLTGVIGDGGFGKSLRAMTVPGFSKIPFYFENIDSGDYTGDPNRRFQLQFGQNQGTPNEFWIKKIEVFGSSALRPLAWVQETEKGAFFMNGHNATSYTFPLNQNMTSMKIDSNFLPVGITSDNTYTSGTGLTLNPKSGIFLFRDIDKWL